MMAKSADQLRKISELENQAKSLRGKMRSKVMPRKPIVIEFSGSPRAGKTQSISSLSVFLRRNDFEVITISEYASINPIRNKFDPVFNVWNACQSLCKLLEVLNSKIQHFDFILVDRGIFDSLCWLKWQHTHGKLSLIEYASISRFLSMQKWVSLVNLVCLFSVSPTKSLEREYANLLTSKPGSVMRPEILAQYNSASESIAEEYRDSFTALERIDTSDLDQNEVGFRITKQILTTLDNVLNENIGFFELQKLEFIERGIVPYRRVRDQFSQIKFAPRVSVEPNSGYIQPVAIALLRDKKRNGAVIGRKSKKSVTSSSPEYEKEVYWFGGHVRKEDAGRSKRNRNVTLLHVLHNALKRELKEELDFDHSPIDPPNFIIWSDHSDSGRRHIAFLFIIDIDFDLVKIHADDVEFHAGDVRFLTFVEYKKKTKLDTDDWSKYILREVLKWDKTPIMSQIDISFT